MNLTYLKNIIRLKMVVIFVLLLGLLHEGSAVDCSDAQADLTAATTEMETYQQMGNLCSHTRSLAERILQYELCTEVEGRTAELWHILSTNCPDGIRDAHTDIPYACRKERCMITPDVEGEINVTETDDGEFEFDELPTSLLNDLLDAFGRAGVNPGASARSSSGQQTLFDNTLRSVGALLTAETQITDFDPFAVCDTLNKLDINRMLQCVINQKTLLKCDGDFDFGEEYDVSSNAQKLADSCSKACINILPEPYHTCQTRMSLSQHLQAIKDAVESDTDIDQACTNVQEDYFDCLTEKSRCCNPLLLELDTLFESFLEHEYGGQTCTNVQLNKMTDCIELQDGETTTEEPNSDSDDDDNPDPGPVQDGNGTKGLFLSPWVVLLLVYLCLFH